MQNKQVLLVKRPLALPDDSTFRVTSSPVPELKANQVLVKNHYLSLDPAMRGWIRDVKSYIPPVQLNSVMRGGTIGRVVDSRSPAFKKGDLCFGMLGWQEYWVGDVKELTAIPDVGIPPTAFLGILGGTGMTAYFGLLEVGKPKAGETVLVSAAAGATGSVVGQIAKIHGCKVVGLAGSQDKCDWLTKELGFDAAINYKTSSNLSADIKKACPQGIDIFFDNVGGEQLDIALSMLRFKGRVVICGAISQYNNASGKPNKGPENYLSLLINSGRMEGFIVFNYKDRYNEARQKLGEWLLAGKLKYREDIVDGLENAPKALLRLFSGANDGKLIVRIAKDDIKPRSRL